MPVAVVGRTHEIDLIATQPHQHFNRVVGLIGFHYGARRIGDGLQEIVAIWNTRHFDVLIGQEPVVHVGPTRRYPGHHVGTARLTLGRVVAALEVVRPSAVALFTECVVLDVGRAETDLVTFRCGDVAHAFAFSIGWPQFGSGEVVVVKMRVEGVKRVGIGMAVTEGAVARVDTLPYLLVGAQPIGSEPQLKRPFALVGEDLIETKT